MSASSLFGYDDPDVKAPFHAKCGRVKTRCSNGVWYCLPCQNDSRKARRRANRSRNCLDCGKRLSEKRADRCRDCHVKSRFNESCLTCGSPMRRMKSGTTYCRTCTTRRSMKSYYCLDAEGRKRRKGDPDKVRIWRRNAKHRRRSLPIVGSHTAVEWRAIIRKQHNRCALCGKEAILTCDHIVPLAKGGSDYAVNIQGLCLHCNCSKQDSMNGVTQVSLFERLVS